MELHEEVGAVRREVVIDRPVEDVWDDVADLSWLEREARIVEEEAPSRLVLEWVDDDSTVVDVRVIEEGRFATRVVVVETPVRVLRAVSSAVVGGLVVAGPTGAGMTGDVFDALADPTRRRIIEALAARPGLTASALADEFPVTRQAIAKHLGVLRAAGLADVVRDGREARYSFTPEPLGDAMTWMVSTGAAWDRRLERLAGRGG